MFQNANYFLNFQKLLGIAKGVRVDNETSQKQILEMYKKGGAYNGQDIPWDVRKAQPALEQLEREGLIKGLVLDAGCGTGASGCGGAPHAPAARCLHHPPPLSGRCTRRQRHLPGAKGLQGRWV